MQQDFLRAPLARFGTPVCRIGLSATYRPGRKTVFAALDEGINYFMYFAFDTHMTRVLRETMYGRREQFVLATGGCNWILFHRPLRRALENRLREMRTDYIDIFHYFGITRRKHFTTQVRDELQAIRESGLVRGVSISCHDRAFAAELARDGTLDSLMIRYNAAHRGAETEIFPQLPATDPAVIAYTATRWTQLFRRPRGYPKDGRIPTPGMCYRFVLSNPEVDVCLMAPSNLGHFERNLAEIRKGPLAEDDMQFMRSFGDFVHGRGQYFM
jgi:aryl-alcohol dehydrogenase-like predicted oxidoreductase